MEEDSDAVDALMHAIEVQMGLTQALKVALVALIATHPAPERFAQVLDAAIEHATAKAIPTPLSETALDAFSEQLHELSAVARVGARSQPGPETGREPKNRR